MAVYVIDENGNPICIHEDMTQEQYLKKVEEACGDNFSCFQDAVTSDPTPTKE